MTQETHIERLLNQVIPFRLRLIERGECTDASLEAVRDAIEEIKATLLTSMPAQHEEIEPPHPDDLAVDLFAIALKTKMAASRAKGRGGWDDPAQCSIEQLQKMLLEHLPKGDPVDVGNFAMMLFIRGGRTIASALMAAKTNDPIDANRLEQMAKERPDECFLKGSGVLKLIGAIRQLEREAKLRELTEDETLQIFMDNSSAHGAPGVVTVFKENAIAIASALLSRARHPAASSTWPVLKGVGKINGDGWKDVTRPGEVVFVWNQELPAPYKEGQYPRIGNKSGWTASTEQYDFQPATLIEIRSTIESLLALALHAGKQT